MTSPSVEDAAAQHVRRTLRALELIAGEPQTQADLARDLAVHRRTARRLLARLVDEGYVEPVTGGRHVEYRATSRLVVLGRQVADGLDLTAIARRHLAELDSDSIGARFLALLDGEAVWLELVEDPGASTGAPATALTRSGPLHATAAGKVFLSADTALLGNVLNQELLAYTERTTVTRADLLLELAGIRERGYAVEDGEHRPDVRTVASPVTDHMGRVVAALGGVPVEGVELGAIGERVRASARDCSEALGASV